ncbi:MAG: FixH family protein [Gaiellaceae bacterium]
MRYVIVLSTLALALAAAATASAGGWATVGMAPLPDGMDSGQTWKTEITVLQHGRTPLDGLSPTLTIRDEGGATHDFAATPTGEPGVYETSVVFPEAGSWSVAVDSGFGGSGLTYGPVSIGVDPGGAPASFPTVPVGAAILAGLALLAAAAFGVRRQRRLTPAS